MRGRYSLIEDGTVRKGGFGKVLFIMDEFFIFRQLVDQLWADMKAEDSDLKGAKHPCLSDWSQLATLARTAEIHLVIGIQRPDAEFVSGLVRDQLRQRSSMDRLTPEAARMLWGSARIGTDLPSVQGRTLTSRDGRPVEAQVLRLLCPSDGDDYTAEDAQVWEEIERRVQTLPADPESAAVLSRIRHGGGVVAVQGAAPTAPSAGVAGPVMLGKPAAAPVPTPAALAPAPAAAATVDVVVEDEDDDLDALSHKLEPVTASHLAPGDQVFLDDEDGTPVLVVLDDVLDDEEDGSIELIYTSLEDGGPGAVSLDPDATLQRYIPA